MSQAERVGPVGDAVGYVLKQAATALRSEMDAVLRPLGLTVPQYACLELLEQHPGSSNADLARGAFVTRQSMNGVLRGLQERRLLTRSDTAPYGRSRPTELTATGRRKLARASRAVHGVEQKMLDGFTDADTRRLLGALAHCVAALGKS